MYGSFYGWYLKAQSDSNSLAVIPAVHKTGYGMYCTVQIITDKGAYGIKLPGELFKRHNQKICIGNNCFAPEGISLALDTPNLTVKGRLHFKGLHPLKYHIMGPFAVVPFMECRHMVFSMRHCVTGSVLINGEEYYFNNSPGYWEGDRGCSFPRQYIWTQCFLPKGSVMLSVADIPFAGIHFTGIIGVILWRGHEYRLATYLGARVLKLRNGVIRIVQNDMELKVELYNIGGSLLKAPQNGGMSRNIRENICCRAYYTFRKGGRIVFEIYAERASYEYEYPY
ncbi:MAG: tocopherol cyclase family protein [Butyrivibrio sp.]